MPTSNSFPNSGGESVALDYDTSAAGQRARLLAAFQLRLPVTTELARKLGIPNLALRLQELRKQGYPVKAWRVGAKNSAGRPVAVFGIHQPRDIRLGSPATTGAASELDPEDIEGGEQ